MNRTREGDAGGFLSRWSRLKQEARDHEHQPQPPAAVLPENEESPEQEREPAPPPEAGAEGDGAPAPSKAADQPPPLDLPDIDTLTRDSDYTAFLRAEVPADMRRQALRKLWRSDPVFANLDGLNDYDENYAAPSIVGAAVRTAYDVFNGYAPRDAAAETEAAEAPDTAAQQNVAAAQNKDASDQHAEGETPCAANGTAAEGEDKKDENGPLSEKDSGGG